ncbi:MAG: acyl-CoA dehydrogenase family protein [Mycobacterium sp.]
MTNPLSGGVFAAAPEDDLAELRQLVHDLGSQSAATRIGRRGLPEEFDAPAWAHLEETGLSRLTTDPELEAGPGEAAVVLRGLARHAVAAPVAETDLLAAWLAGAAGLDVPATGPLTVAIADAERDDDRLKGTARGVPWTRVAERVLLALSVGDEWLVSAVHSSDLDITDAHNLAGEPRDTVGFAVPAAGAVPVGADVVAELRRRGAWARCVQVVGALDAAAELSVSHTRDRVQFGRALSKFQAVQHALAGMAGEIERARASATLAVAAAADYGFDSAQTEYAVTLAKVALGRVVPAVNTVAHQLHGALGVTIEHQLWSATNRAHSWIDEFGSTGQHARRLGRATLTGPVDDDGALWDVLTGADLRTWA